MLKNLSKHISFVILLCLGFFLMPSISYACAKKTTKTEQKSCSKDQSAKAEHKSSCKDKSCKKCKDGGHDCNSNCKHGSCGCSISSSFHLMIFSFKIFALDLITSLLTSKLSFEISDCICVDLPPGAAQRSNTFNGLFSGKHRRKTCSKNMELASCT